MITPTINSNTTITAKKDNDYTKYMSGKKQKSNKHDKNNKYSDQKNNTNLW